MATSTAASTRARPAPKADRLSHDQARRFARTLPQPLAMVSHSRGAPGRADRRGHRRRKPSGPARVRRPARSSRSASWRTATTTHVAQFNAICSISIRRLDVPMCPVAETATEVLDRYVGAHPSFGCATSTITSSPATSSWSATAPRSGWSRTHGRVDSSFALDHHRATPNPVNCWRRSPTGAGALCAVGAR